MPAVTSMPRDALNPCEILHKTDDSAIQRVCSLAVPTILAAKVVVNKENPSPQTDKRTLPVDWKLEIRFEWNFAHVEVKLLSVELLELTDPV